MAVMALVLLTGACSIFAAAITASQAWEEHQQASWPQVMSQSQNCELATSSYSPHRIYIRCAFGYAVGGEAHVAHFYSRQFAPAGVWQYPPNQASVLYDWLNAHLDGAPIVLRYNPANPAKAVMASDYLPGHGAHTPNNLKLLAAFASAFVALLVIGRLTRPRTPWQVGKAPAPLG